MKFRTGTVAASSFYSPDKRRFLYKQEAWPLDWFKSSPHYGRIDKLQIGETIEVQSEKSNKTFKIRRIK